MDHTKKPGIYETRAGFFGAAIALLALSAATLITLGLLVHFMWEMFLLGWNL